MTNELINKSLVKSTISILAASEKLEKSYYKILIVLDENDKIIGTVTDGDIRRSIIKKINLNNPVLEIMNVKPIIFKSSHTRFEKEKTLKTLDLKYAPVIDERGKVIDFFVKTDSVHNENFKSKFIIMAGGRGSRLLPYTEDCPKPMLKIQGKPILEHIILNAKKFGFNNFVISINYLGEVIESYFKDGGDLGVSITYIKETHPLGTIGSLSLLNIEEQEPFIVTNGDVITNINYLNFLEYHLTNKASVTLAIKEYKLQNQFGVIKMSGESVISLEEKPTYSDYINAGVYAFNPNVLNYLDANFKMDLPTLINKLIEVGLPIKGFPLFENWIDIGTPIEYKKITTDFDFYE